MTISERRGDTGSAATHGLISAATQLSAAIIALDKAARGENKHRCVSSVAARLSPGMIAGAEDVNAAGALGLRTVASAAVNLAGHRGRHGAEPVKPIGAQMTERQPRGERSPPTSLADRGSKTP